MAIYSQNVQKGQQNREKPLYEYLSDNILQTIYTFLEVHEIAQSSIAPKERMKAFNVIQQIIFDDAVILPMYERGLTYVIHPQLKNVKRRVLGASTDYTKAYVTSVP